jgi:hypothetical protein
MDNFFEQSYLPGVVMAGPAFGPFDSVVLLSEETVGGGSNNRFSLNTGNSFVELCFFAQVK